MKDGLCTLAPWEGLSKGRIISAELSKYNKSEISDSSHLLTDANYSYFLILKDFLQYPGCLSALITTKWFISIPSHSEIRASDVSDVSVSMLTIDNLAQKLGSLTAQLRDNYLLDDVGQNTTQKFTYI